jgi:hypothetical protein
MAYRNTKHEEEKVAGAQRRCPKLTLSVEKPDKYVLTGCDAGGTLVIEVSAWGIGAAIRLFGAEYFRLDQAGILAAKAASA